MAKIIFTGISAYACGAWDKKTKHQFFKCFPPDLQNPAIAMLYGPWDTPKMIQVAKRFCKKFQDREHLIELCLSPETARRTGRSGNQISPGLCVRDYDKALRAKQKVILEAVDLRVRELLPLFAAVANENTHLWLSTGLEHNLSLEAATVLARTVKKAVREWRTKGEVLFGPTDPFCGPIRIINNPMKQSGPLPVKGVLTERHGRNIGGTEVHNWDGVHCGAIDSNAIEDCGYENVLKAIQKAKGKYKAMFLWSALAQGWRNQPAQPYEGRTYVISPEEIAGFNMILRSI